MSSVTNTGDIWLVLAETSDHIMPLKLIQKMTLLSVSEGKPDFQIFVLYCTKGSNF